MKKIFEAALQELHEFRKDYIVLLIFFGGIIFYSFYYPFPYSKETVRDIPIAVVDNDKSDLSKKITRMLDETENIDVTTEYNSILAAKQAFMERKVFGIINIPENFYKDVVWGNSPVVTLFADASYMIFYSTALSASTQIVLTAAAGVKIKQMTMSGTPYYDVMNIQSSLSMTGKALFNPSGGYGTFVIPAVYTVILQQVFLIILSLLQGTGYEKGYNFLKNTGALSILLGKLLFFLPLFMVAFGYLFFIGSHVFDLPIFGSVKDIVLFIIPYGTSIILLGITMGFFVREREGGMVFALMTSIPFLFLSGFLWPTYLMPEILQGLRLLIPSSLGIDGLVKIRQMGAGLPDVMFDFLGLWVMTFLYGITAYLSIKWQMKNNKIHKG